jgi:hypothetical protein
MAELPRNLFRVGVLVRARVAWWLGYGSVVTGVATGLQSWYTGVRVSTEPLGGACQRGAGALKRPERGAPTWSLGVVVARQPLKLRARVQFSQGLRKARMEDWQSGNAAGC